MGADESPQHSGQRNGAVIALEFLLNGIRERFAQHSRSFLTACESLRNGDLPSSIPISFK